jgi:hypothetical protein
LEKPRGNNWNTRAKMRSCWLGMRTLRTVGGDESITRFAHGLPWCHSIFADMGRYSGREGIDNLTYALMQRLAAQTCVVSLSAEVTGCIHFCYSRRDETDLTPLRRG